MIFDTDVLVWHFRGLRKASRLIDDTPHPHVSIITYMELLQGAPDKTEMQRIRRFLGGVGFVILPLTENIGHRGAIYMEEFALNAAMEIPDALIAATAVENNLPLCTGNRKHYQQINELELRVFRR